MLKCEGQFLIKPDNNQSQLILDLIENSGGTIFHETDLNRIVSESFGTELFYFVDNTDRISNCSPIHRVKGKFGNAKYFAKPLYDMPYGGFVVDNGIDLDKFSLGPFDSFAYTGFPNPEGNIESIKGVGKGETSMVDLCLDEDAIFSTVIHAKSRNMIRKALKSDIEVVTYSSIEGLELFWKMLKPLHDKLGYSKLTYDYYKRIFLNYNGDGKAFVLISFLQGEPISGVFLLGNKNYMHYYKGASVSGSGNYGQGEVLQWEAIKLSKKLGCRFYDLCNLDKIKLPHIYRFKTHISNSIYHYFSFSKSSVGFKMGNKLSKIFNS